MTRFALKNEKIVVRVPMVVMGAPRCDAFI